VADKHWVTVGFEQFGWETLTAEAERQGVTVEELLVHAAMYYLSDLESGRVAARVFRQVEAAEAGEQPEKPEQGGERRFRPSGERDEPKKPEDE
jgi:hypothetical protein